MELVVGMGQYIISDREDDIIRTYALASCVAVTVYSSRRKIAGMIHVVLPSPLASRDIEERPAYFAETGVPLLINTLCERYGCRKEEFNIHMYGGAESIGNQDIFNVGQKNIVAIKHTLQAMGLAVHKADLRGRFSRTLVMEVRTGTVAVHRQAIAK